MKEQKILRSLCQHLVLSLIGLGLIFLVSIIVSRSIILALFLNKRLVCSSREKQGI